MYILSKILNKSLMTLDYSMENINDYETSLIDNKVKYFPMPIINFLDTAIYTHDYDLLFFGSYFNNSTFSTSTFSTSTFSSSTFLFNNNI